MKKSSIPTPNWCCHHLLLGGCDILEDLQSFQENYSTVSHVLCVAEECNCSHHISKCSSLKHKKLILQDFVIPAEEELQEQFSVLESAIEFIDEAIQQNRTCYVHCMRGRSRSSTVIICYLMKKKLLTLKEAYLLVKINRHFIGPHRSLKFIIEKYEEYLVKQNHYSKTQQGQEKNVLEMIDEVCDPSSGTYKRHDDYHVVRSHLEQIMQRIQHTMPLEGVSITAKHIKMIELELKAVMANKAFEKVIREEEKELQQKQQKALCVAG